MADIPKPPPNLRVADNESEECDSCKHFMPGDMCGCCKLYGNLPVQDEWVCDSWAKGSQPDNDSDEPKASNVREAEQNARTRMRAARRQQTSDSTSGQ